MDDAEHEESLKRLQVFHKTFVEAVETLFGGRFDLDEIEMVVVGMTPEVIGEIRRRVLDARCAKERMERVA